MQFTKRIMAFAALGVALAGSALAQERATYEHYPHGFIGIQGGGQTTFTNYDNLKLITPTASIYGGYWFTNVVGARLHVNGMWNKGGVKQTSQKYDYNYVTTDLDLMLNLTTMFGKKDYYPLNVYLIGGAGLNTAWNNDDALAIGKTVLNDAWDGTKLSHNARVGVQLDYNIIRNLSVNLEVAANSLNDRFNSKRGGGDDWQLTAQVGVAFKFGHKKKPIPQEGWETRIDTTWYDDVTYKEVTRARDIKREIFFEIRSDSIDNEDAQITAVAEFLKTVKDAEITIAAYADKGTGNPKINMEYSKKRALSTQRKLIERGVDPNVFKNVEWKGDTVQPFAENDKNRVSIITGKGVYADKDRVVTKKFRTKEVRYRVQ